MTRCQIIPEPHDQFSFSLDGREVTRWHFGSDSPRPFFYPIRGPQGAILTRMGHPGAPNHDHHRSVWFAHHKVMGVDFWSDETTARQVQREWLTIAEHDEWAGLAVEIDWVDGHDPQPLMQQQVIAIMHPDQDEQFQLEIQTELKASHGAVELGQTNFGLIAVRVAKEISAYFGNGELTCSEGRQGEPAIFGQSARWMDYSGRVTVANDGVRGGVDVGITLFDHPQNVSYPSHWHVRQDGWMGASVNRLASHPLAMGESLKLRYLLDIHRGLYAAERAAAVAERFAQSPSWKVGASKEPHIHAELQRESGSGS